MKKITILLLLLSAITRFEAFSQQLKQCGNPVYEQQLKEQYPQILIEEQKFQDFLVQWIENNKNNASVRDGDSVYIIPIVFHIIHDYGTENISDDQIRDAMRIINEDYRKLNADTTAIIPEFKAVAGDAHIEFRLANKTPGGDCTNGIEHIHSLSTYSGGDNAKLSDWPRSMYLNVWTVKTLSGNLAGYAYNATTVAIPFLAPVDGVIILSNYVGSIGTSSPSTSRALTHEIGHTLNLQHPWGPNNFNDVACGDDGVFDTPITKGSATAVCNLNLSVCTPGVIENVQNYMDYSYCSKMFTNGQIQVMQGCLNSIASERNNLWSASNLIATGTDDTIEPTCTPRVDFYSSVKMGCSGTSITFHDVSWGGPVDSRQWNFGDGNPATSTDKDPTVTFSTPGWKTVALTATNSTGSATETQEKYIFISDDAGQFPIGWFENFEDPNSFDNDYIVQNREGNQSYWSRITTTGYQSNSCVYLNNFGNMIGDIDNLISPSFDLSPGGPLYLNFRIACASHATSVDLIDDVLKIYSSIDCGRTWIVRNTISGVDLANANYFDGNFAPTSADQWEGRSILLPSAVYNNNVRFKFEYTTNGYGNNVYIDDINVSQFPVGINDPAAASFSVKVFPNPVTEASVVSIQQKLSANVRIRIIDQMGREIKSVYSGWLSEGTHQFDLKASDLDVAGMYYLVIDDGITISREKIVVQ